MDKIMAVSDVHLPFHDAWAWSCVLNAVKFFKPKLFVINGDAVDFYSISSHSRDPKRKQSLGDELRVSNTEFDHLAGLLPSNVEVIYTCGNHEDRLGRYVEDHSSEIAEIVPDVYDLLGIKRRGWRWVPYKEHVRIGNTYYVHDIGSCGRYAHYKAMDLYQHNIVTGHTHRLGYAVEGNAAGKPHFTLCTGWLGDLKSANYETVARRSQWAHGFAYGYTDRRDLTLLTPVPIVNRVANVEGKIIKA